MTQYVQRLKHWPQGVIRQVGKTMEVRTTSTVKPKGLEEMFCPLKASGGTTICTHQVSISKLRGKPSLLGIQIQGQFSRKVYTN